MNNAPADPEALKGALAFLREGNFRAAEQTLRDHLSVLPDDASALHLMGVAQLELGNASGALRSFDRALRNRPGVAMLLYNRGNALAALGRLDEAAGSFSSALAVQPEMAEAHFNLGNALRALGHRERALASYGRAGQLRPALAQAWNNAGSVLHELGRMDKALASFERAIAANPGHAEALKNRAFVLQELDRHVESVAAYDDLVARGVATPDVFNRRGIALHKARRFDAALASYDGAISLDANFADAWNNRGNALHDLRRMDQALASYERAVALEPRNAEAANNHGMVLQDLGKLEAARSEFDRALQLRPEYPEAFKRRAGLNLLEGRFPEGWSDFEAAMLPASATSALPGVPYWQGQSLEGRTILLSEPSGLGDTLQFFRFVPALLERGARVSFHGPASLLRLLSSFPHPVELLSKLAGRRFDFQCRLWSLPHYLGVDLAWLPGETPYLFPEPALVEKWSALLDPGAFNIGICWQGNPDRKIDPGRSIPLLEFMPLAQVPGVNLVSLQKNFGVEQLRGLPPGMRVRDPGDGFDAGSDAFVDSAGLLKGLDLVIASDTSVVHLAGAMAIPTWVAVNFVPEWRWMIDRDDCPWYPGMRVFRQQQLDEWPPVFAKMAAALSELVARRRGFPVSS